jgi:uncharacterized protein YdeI (YjbR/CyaY-like superfamily)
VESFEPKKHIWDKNNNWTVELDLLKEIISQTELVETIKWGGPVYVLNGKNVLGIGGFKTYFGIWFYNGVFLKDEHNILINAQEGVTKSLRQLRFQHIEEVHRETVLLYIKEAISNEKLGKSIKPEKKTQLIAPELNIELSKNFDLAKAFKNFTFAKQQEFIEYITTAKREGTKLSRVEKIKPMILQNKGLNDKYK